MIFKCERCGFNSYLKSNVIRHLKNKKECPSILTSESRDNCLLRLLNREYVYMKEEKSKNIKLGSKKNKEEKVRKITTEKNIPFSQDEMSKFGAEDDFFEDVEKSNKMEEVYVCEYCEKEFNHKNYYYTHRKHYCKKKKREESDEKMMSQQMKEIIEKINSLEKKLENSGSRINNGNITYGGNINNIHINKFCYEDRSYITEEFINRLGHSQLYHIPSQIAKLIHINPDHSENCNVKISSTRSKIATIYNGEKWIKDDKKKILERILRDSMDLFDEKYSGGRKTVEKFTKKYFDNDKEIARALGINLELMFINNLDLIEKICKERESVLEI